MSQQPIGIFDSGVGGLSILKAIQEHLPNENLLYFADSKYAPYGQLEESILKERCLFIADFFAKKNAKAMVIACNTATAFMAEWLREKYDLPIVAIEPAIKPAAQQTKTKKIGVFATTHTLNSERYQSLKKRYAEHISVYESDCQGFVEQVERGELESLNTIGLIEKNLLPMLDNEIDTLVLGCTHYPFLTPAIQQITGRHALSIIDNADAVSLQLMRILQEKNLLNKNSHLSSHYFSSTIADKTQLFSKLLGKPIKVENV